MKKQQYSLLILILLTLLLTGCTNTRSQWSHFRGSRCLNNGDYDNAVVHLGKAVELDPTVAVSQRNLAEAYLGAGEIEKSWDHSRQAILYDRHNFDLMQSFMRSYTAMVELKGLEKGVSNTDDVVAALGEPDFTCTEKKKRKNILTYVYGLMLVKFHEGTVISLDL